MAVLILPDCISYGAAASALQAMSRTEQENTRLLNIIAELLAIARGRGTEASNCHKRPRAAEEVSTARLALNLLQQVLHSQAWSARHTASLTTVQAVVMG